MGVGEMGVGETGVGETGIPRLNYVKTAFNDQQFELNAFYNYMAHQHSIVCPLKLKTEAKASQFI